MDFFGSLERHTEACWKVGLVEIRSDYGLIGAWMTMTLSR